MIELQNAKAEAWDLVGNMFWTLGRQSARPTPREIDLFLEGVSSNTKVCIIGASTKELVEAAAGRGARTHVLDFSSRMCSDLRSALDNPCVTVEVRDLTAPLPDSLTAGFDLVLSDRLINRFDDTEIERAVHGMVALAKPGGTVRTSVKLGLYPMDERMIEAGRQAGTLANFFDEHTRTINYAAAGSLLDEMVLPHGDIPRDVLLNWYRGRRREKRYIEDDLIAFGCDLTTAGVVNIAKINSFPDAPGTVLWMLRRGSPAS